MDVSSLVILGAVCLAFTYAAIKKVDIVGSFTKGAGENLKVAAGLLPTLVLLMLAITMMRSSGILDVIVGLIRPAAEKIGFPAECLPLAILRPISGSGAIALLDDVLNKFGADSFAGRTASVLAASSETTFYTVAVYFAAVKAKKPQKAIIAALAGDLTAFLTAALAVRHFFGAG